MLHDLETFGRRRPWSMVAAGVAVGFAASRFLKASSRNRYEASVQGGSPRPVVSGEPAGAQRVRAQAALGA